VDATFALCGLLNDNTALYLKKFSFFSSSGRKCPKKPHGLECREFVFGTITSRTNADPQESNCISKNLLKTFEK
jgi:hypothetical protein